MRTREAEALARRAKALRHADIVELTAKGVDTWRTLDGMIGQIVRTEYFLPGSSKSGKSYFLCVFQNPTDPWIEFGCYVDYGGGRFDKKASLNIYVELGVEEIKKSSKWKGPTTYRGW